MYCPKCGTQNNDESRFCVNCGTPIKTSSNPAGKSGAVSMPKRIDESTTMVIVIAFAAVCFLSLIGTIIFFKIVKGNSIIGTWTECDDIVNGVSSADTDPTYLKEYGPDTIRFYKDGSLKFSNDWGEDTGTWQEVTTDAHDYPTYYVTVDGESGYLYIKNHRLYLVINAYESRVFKK